MTLNHKIVSEFSLEDTSFLIVKFSGTLDEKIDLSFVLEQIATKHLIIDTRGLDKINSLGVSAWLDFMDVLNEKQISIYFVHCSYELILQKGIIDNFIPKSSNSFLLSFHLALCCDDCQANKIHEFTALDVKNLPPNSIPEVMCGQCGSFMECDEIESQFYNAFIDLKRSLVLGGLIEPLLAI